MRHRRRVGGLAATVAAGLLGLAACSSGTPGAAGTSGGPSGAPIVVMATAPVDAQLVSLPQFIDVAQAYAKQVNAAGGINGRPLQITTCDNQASPTQTAACARQAVSDKAVATVGWAIESPAFLQVLADARIPWVPGTAQTPDAFTNTNSFPVTVGSLQQGMGQVAAAVKEGCRSVALVTNESLVARAKPQQDGLTKQGVGVRVITYPTNVSDIGPIVAQMKGSDCLIIGATSDTFVAQLGAALPQAGITFSRIISNASLTKELVSQNPATWDGTVVTGLVTNVQGPQWKGFRDAIAAYSTVDKQKHSPTTAQPVWVAMSVLSNTIREMVSQGKDVTGANLQQALGATTSANSDDTGPPLNFTTQSRVPGFPRLFAPYMGFSVVKNGDVVPAYDGTYHDIQPFILGEKSTDPFFAIG
ncbi:ABC transporter substrate-binding protein [Pseudonocardia ailaonensis]|uniref:ABC transporter substrate-binding protein n=1 Tax=Pseudonocardia ailaonensis TaxID=367279 RepID=A0ABN2N9H9_9PSEU